MALPGWDIDTALAALGIDRVTFDMVNGNAQGFSFEDDNGRHLAINPAAVYPAKALLHELAHLTLGHCKDGDNTHRGVAEFEAEATAYLVAKELELIDWNSSESRAYIQGWLGGTEVCEDNIHPSVRGRQQNPDRRPRPHRYRCRSRGVKRQERKEVSVIVSTHGSTSRFDRVVPGAIVANTGVLGWSWLDHAHAVTLEQVDTCFLVFFLVELVTRLRHGGRRWLRQPWNLVDATIILLALLPVLGDGITVLRLPRLARSAHLLRHASHLWLWRPIGALR